MIGRSSVKSVLSVIVRCPIAGNLPLFKPSSSLQLNTYTPLKAFLGFHIILNNHENMDHEYIVPRHLTGSMQIDLLCKMLITKQPQREVNLSVKRLEQCCQALPSTLGPGRFANFPRNIFEDKRPTKKDDRPPAHFEFRKKWFIGG